MRNRKSAIIFASHYISETHCKGNKKTIGMALKILVENGDKRKLKELCKCTFPTVRAALNGKETTSLHMRIREKALEMGGIEVLPYKRVYEIAE